MTVSLSVSVDWEGRALDPLNIEAIRNLSSDFPDLPVEHFICPSYFTRGFDNTTISATILSAIKANDVKSLHVHCWYSLVGNFAAPVIETPTWLPDNDPGAGVPYGDDQMDYGHAVPLGLYTAQQITAILAGSRQVLAENGIIDNVASCTGFRCGGWVAANVVLQGLAGVTPDPFKYDASGASGDYCAFLYENGIYPIPLFSWLGQMWDGSLVTAPVFLANSQTHAVYPGGVQGLFPPDPSISSPAMVGSLEEVPNTGMMADYVDIKIWKKYIDKAFELDPQTDVYLNIGFHQETATVGSIFESDLTNIQTVKAAIKYYLSKGGDSFVTRKQQAQSRRKQIPARLEELRQQDFLPA